MDCVAIGGSFAKLGNHAVSHVLISTPQNRVFPFSSSIRIRRFGGHGKCCQYQLPMTIIFTNLSVMRPLLQHLPPRHRQPSHHCACPDGRTGKAELARLQWVLQLPSQAFSLISCFSAAGSNQPIITCGLRRGCGQTDH